MWTNIITGINMGLESFKDNFLGISISLTLFSSILYYIEGSLIQTSVYSVSTIILINIYDFKKEVLEKLEKLDK